MEPEPQITTSIPPTPQDIDPELQAEIDQAAAEVSSY